MNSFFLPIQVFASSQNRHGGVTTMGIGCLFSLILAVAVTLDCGLIGTIHAQETPQQQSAREGSQTFSLESFAQRSFNYCNRMVDKAGFPFLNVFWTEPAEAAHDWP